MKIKSIIYPLISILIVFIIWLIASLLASSPILLPSPIESIRELGNIFVDISFYKSFLFTLIRSALSFIVSLAIAFILAIFSLNKRVDKILSPLVSIVKAIPTMAIILILVLLLSASVAPIVVALIVLIPVLYSAIKDSILSVDPKLLEMARLYDVDKRKVIKKIYLPKALVGMNESLTQALGLSLKLVVAAEVMSHPFSSIGNLMYLSKLNLEISYLFALVIICVITSVLLELCFSKATKAILRKKYGA